MIVSNLCHKKSDSKIWPENCSKNDLLPRSFEKPVTSQYNINNNLNKTALTIAAMGKVSTQDKIIFEIIFLSDFPVALPIPKMEPTETWVVETGNP